MSKSRISCECGVYECDSRYYGHTCRRDYGHLGPHSCHRRVFRQEPRPGDFVWQDEDTSKTPAPEVNA